MAQPMCDCQYQCPIHHDVPSNSMLPGVLGTLMDSYKINKHYFWPVYFIIVYLRYISTSRSEAKKLPICSGTYSNECDATDVYFLNDVIQFVNDSGAYIITKWVTFIPASIFQNLSTVLVLFSFIFPFLYPNINFIPFSFFSSVFVSASLLIMFPSYGSFISNILTFFGVGDLMHLCNEYKQEYNEFFVGLCYYCKIPGKPPKEPLLRCDGCQLVAYCSNTCMNSDKSSHKYVCQEFALISGKNCLETTGSWKEHIAGLSERAARLPHGQVAAKAIFRNPRVCHNCREARSDRLTDCECACVSYCSKKCANIDKKHKEDCSHLAYIAQSYYLCVAVDLEFMKHKTWFRKVQSSLTNECNAFPMSLLFALQSLPKHSIGSDHCSLEDFTCLELHVVTSSPILNSKSWEVGFLHSLPKLKHINVVFITQGKSIKPHFFHNIRLNGFNNSRCKDCKVKNRVITFTVQQMEYHMYFSSSEYTDPDVVVVFHNSHEMSLSEEDDIHSEISYRNMTYSRDTVLVLMDTTKDLVKEGARAVNSAQPVEQLVSPRINQNRGIGATRADLDSHAGIVNEKSFFTCLQRK